MNTFYQVGVICPFFIDTYPGESSSVSFAKRSVVCEGVFEETKITSTFTTEKEKKQHCKNHCCSFNYSQCPIYRMVESIKYRGDT